MTTKIFKYPLKITDEQTIQMPQFAQFLSVQEQHGRLWVWALVSEDLPLVDTQFYIFGTGNPFPPLDHALKHIGTAMTLGGAGVWHVFVEEPGPVDAAETKLLYAVIKDRNEQISTLTDELSYERVGRFEEGEND